MSEAQQDLFISGKSTWFHFFVSSIESGDLAMMSKQCGAVASVLLVIKSYSNYKEGVSFPGIQTIVDKSGFAKNSVMRAIKILVEYGYLNCKREGRKNIYTVVEKFKMEHRDTGEEVEVSANYVPQVVSAMREELKEFIKDGRSQGKYINIPITIQIVNGGTGNQIVTSDINADLVHQIENSGTAVGKLQEMVDNFKGSKALKEK
jgi:hypothetical protein